MFITIHIPNIPNRYQSKSSKTLTTIRKKFIYTNWYTQIGIICIGIIFARSKNFT